MRSSPPDIRPLVRRFADAAGGQTSIEFALVCLPLFLLMFGILQFAIFAFQSQQLAAAVQDLGRNGAPKLRSLSQVDLTREICNRARLGDPCIATLVIELRPLLLVPPGATRIEPAFAPQGGNTIMLLRVRADVPSIVPVIGKLRTAATTLFVGT